MTQRQLKYGRAPISVSVTQMITHQIIPKQQDTLVVVGSRDGEHEDGPNNGQHADGGDGQALSLPVRCSPGGPNNHEELDGAKRDVEENGVKVGVAKVPDNQAAKCTNAAARNPKLSQYTPTLRLVIVKMEPTRWPQWPQTSTKS